MFCQQPNDSFMETKCWDDTFTLAPSCYGQESALAVSLVPHLSRVHHIQDPVSLLVHDPLVERRHIRGVVGEAAVTLYDGEWYSMARRPGYHPPLVKLQVTCQQLHLYQYLTTYERSN